MTTEEFRRRWLALVAAWRRAGEGSAAAGSLLREALESGLAGVETGAGGTTRPTAEDELRCQVDLVRASGEFDAAGYDRANRLRGRIDPVRHFCTTGWRDFHNPSLRFDLWWYWFTVLGLDQDDVNPFVHYLLVGRHEGLAPLPLPVERRSEKEPPHDAGVRRAFLFAGYDIDREVDPYVVRFVKELSRHGDVFYLADSPLADDQLEKLRAYTAGAWAIHHGRYDFGSYAMLARDLVGWDRLDDYDEVVLVNDSCYLLRPLDDVFARMDQAPCDWWGLQASKRDFDRAHGHRRPIPMAQATAELVGSPEWHQLLFLHISSYFVALRRPAFTDPGFHRLMDQVSSQRRKDDIIFKYELGMSRQLLAGGHAMATFIDDLYPFHPVYTEDHFELIARGFPLLKRSFLIDNTERTPDLARWRERVLTVVPDAPVDEIEQNLRRVGAHDALTASFSISSTSAEQPQIDPTRLSVSRLRREDRRTPKHDHWWAFVVDSHTHQLSSDARVLFDSVALDPSLKKVVVTRSRDLDLTGVNVEVHPMSSPRGLDLLLRSRQVLVSGEPRREVPYALSLRAHNFVHLGFPHPLRVFGAGRGPDALDEALEMNRIRYRGVVTGSRLTSMEAATGLYPTPANAMWPLGCPRHDLVHRAAETLPDDLRRQHDVVRSILDGRRAVLWTFGTADPREQPFDQAQLAALAEWSRRSDVVILTREASTDRRRRHADALAGIGAVELTHRELPHLEVVYSLVDAMVTDDSPHVVDFLLTGKPVVTWAPSSADASPWLCDPAVLLPGPACATLEELLTELRRLQDEPSAEAWERYVDRRRLLIEHADGHSSRRVADHLRRLRTDDLDFDQLAAERRTRERRKRLASGGR